MTLEESDQITRICNEVIDGRITTARTIAKYTLWAVGTILLILFPVLYFVDAAKMYKTWHNETFPVIIKMEPDTVLITAYSKEFILKKGDPTINESGYLRFYAEPGQKIRYIINAQHRFYTADSRRRKFFVEVDGDKQYHGKSIVEHGGGMHEVRIKNLDTEDEINLHTFGFRFDPDQKKKDYDETDEVFISCVVLVFGKQYKI